MTQLYAPYYKTITNVKYLATILTVQNALQAATTDRPGVIDPTTLEDLFSGIISSGTMNPTDKLYIYQDGSRKNQNDDLIGIVNPEGQNLLTGVTHSSYHNKYFNAMGGHPIVLANLANGVYYFQDWTDISDAFQDKYTFDGTAGRYTGYQYFLGNFYRFSDGQPFKWYIVARHPASTHLVSEPYYSEFSQFTLYGWGLNSNGDAIYSPS